MKKYHYILACSLIALLIYLFSFSNVYKKIELSLLDLRYQSRNPIEISEQAPLWKKTFLKAFNKGIKFFQKPVPQNKKIGMIIIDLKSLKKIGKWPWPRKYEARLINIMKGFGARSLGFDIFFNEPSKSELHKKDIDQVRGSIQQAFSDPTLSGKRLQESVLKKVDKIYVRHDQFLAESAKKSGNVFIGMILGQRKGTDKKGRDQTVLNALKRHTIPDAPGLSSLLLYKKMDPPLPMLCRAVKGVGLAQIIPDKDGSVRHYPLVIRFGGRVYFALAMRMALNLYQVPIDKVEIVPGRWIRIPNPKDPETGKMMPDIFVPIDKRGLMLINWAGDFSNAFQAFPDALIRELALRQAYEDMKQKIPPLDPQNFSSQNIQDIKDKQWFEDPDLLDGLIPYLGIAKTIENNLRIDSQLIASQVVGGKEEYDDPNEYQDNLDIFLSVKIGNAYAKILQGGKASAVDQFKREIWEDTKGISKDALENLFSWMDHYHSLGASLERHRPFYFFFSPPVLEGKKIFPDHFKGWTLVEGLTATGTHDLNPMPYSPRYPMVGAHVNILNSILTRSFLRDESSYTKVSVTLFIVLISLALIIAWWIPEMSLFRGSATALGLTLLYIAINFYIFNYWGIWFDLLAPILTIFLSYLLILLIRVIAEQREKLRVKGIFSRFVSPDYVQLLVEDEGDLELGGELKELTVYFSDLAGFTTISETLRETPHELVSILNEYFEAMTEILFKYQGTLDKYIGDAIMAFWGAPLPIENHELKGCYAALDMRARMLEVQKDILSRGYPKIHCRAGVNTGMAVVGNMGSLQRTDYTIIGDPVNLGARLEPANKPFGTDIMISEYTYEKVKEKVVARLLDRLQVKGKTEPVKGYELIAKTGEVSDAFLETLDIYNRGMEAYFPGRNWDEAIKLFSQASERLSGDIPSLFYVDRCKAMKESPPPEQWDGRTILTTK